MCHKELIIWAWTWQVAYVAITLHSINSAISWPPHPYPTSDDMDSTPLRRQLALAAQKRATPEESPKNTKWWKATASGRPEKGKNVPCTQTAGYKKTTDLRKVDQLVMIIINKNLANTWMVNNSHQMCIIFDPVNTTCQFAQDMHYNKDIQFPDADPRGGMS